MKFYQKPSPDLVSKAIAYAYPTSPRADYFSSDGCWFVEFNGGVAHSGPFASIEEAEKWCDTVHAEVPYGPYSRRSDKAKEKFLKSGVPDGQSEQDKAQ